MEIHCSIPSNNKDDIYREWANCKSTKFKSLYVKKKSSFSLTDQIRYIYCPLSWRNLTSRQAKSIFGKDFPLCSLSSVFSPIQFYMLFKCLLLTLKIKCNLYLIGNYLNLLILTLSYKIKEYSELSSWNNDPTKNAQNYQNMELNIL